MGAAHEVGIGDVVQESGVERDRVVVVDAYRPIRVWGDGYGIGTAAQAGETLADGREERTDVHEAADRRMLAGLGGNHPAVGVRHDDRRPTLVEHRGRRRGVRVEARAGTGRWDSRLSARGQRHRGARDSTAVEERGGRRPPPSPVTGERSVDEHDPHAKNASRTGSYVKSCGRWDDARNPNDEPPSWRRAPTRCSARAYLD